MLKNVDLTLKLDKPEFKETVETLGEKLCNVQRQCREANIPVIIVFEGWSASGKGSQIGSLMQWLDPRGFEVFGRHATEEEESKYPFLKKFWECLPAKGKIGIFNYSPYRTLIHAYEAGKSNTDDKLREIMSFEQMLTDSGALIIKLFLHITAKEQKKRLDNLKNSKETAWRVKKSDLQQNKDYDKLLKSFDKMLKATNNPNAPWTIIEATDRRYAKMKIFQTVVDAMEKAVETKVKTSEDKAPIKTSDTQGQESTKVAFALDCVDLSKSLDEVESKTRRKSAQADLTKLHNRMYLEGVSAVAVFEGWDAGGKGGAIKRLAKPLDPRGYKVAPYGAPNDVEKAYHYLWRFWNEVPRAGHLTIFDRSWYGRVLVERVEGFCSEADWHRAYDEINDFEEQLVRSGIVVMKFWMQIDKDEQLRRFESRQSTPDKQWKITDEDWRNRDKWDSYLAAVNDMLLKTSTAHAPWTIVEGNDKPFARVKVLETVRDRLKEAL